MKFPQIISQRIFDRPALIHQVNRWRLLGKTIAFTNGCFDILHQGHIASLSDAAREADILVVGLNSDESTTRLKGPGRPVNDQHARSIVLAALLMVDAVTLFDEDTPFELINLVRPDVLVKGGDYTLEQIVGAKEVLSWGGRVVINPIIPGFSTTGILEKISRL
jgi:rfaE bifunctional protein nucleotidyltransferase chain/domain